MYHVLLADDEEIIREGVRCAIPWRTLGLELIAIAADGEEAFRLAKRYRPDVVITDIRMPLMDGLDLIRALHEQLPDCKILILTGHGEFDYARTALQLGVSDYLLKPVDVHSLCDILNRLRRELDKEHSHQNELELLYQKAQEEQVLQQQRLLQRYLAGRANAEELNESLSEDLVNTQFCAGVLVQMDDFDRLTGCMNEEAIFSFTQELERTLIANSDEYIRIVENDNGRYFIIFVGQRESELRFHVHSYIQRLRTSIVRTVYTTIASSIVNGSLTQCRTAYEETLRCIDRIFLLGTGQDIKASEVLGQNFTSMLPTGIDMQGVIHALSNFDRQAIHKNLMDLAEQIRQTTHNSYLYASMSVSFIYGESIRLLTERHYPVQSILPEPVAEYSRLMACQSLDDMIRELLALLNNVCAFLEENANINLDIVERAKIYIQEHYSDAKLSLEIVSAAVGISAAYLSALFKQKSGQSFVSYLTEIRLSRAQQMLRTGDFRSYEVAYKCGYDNSTYFSTIFKRHFGVSPSEYGKNENSKPVKDGQCFGNYH